MSYYFKLKLYQLFDSQAKALQLIKIIKSQIKNTTNTIFPYKEPQALVEYHRDPVQLNYKSSRMLS